MLQAMASVIPSLKDDINDEEKRKKKEIGVIGCGIYSYDRLTSNHKSNERMKIHE